MDTPPAPMPPNGQPMIPGIILTSAGDEAITAGLHSMGSYGSGPSDSMGSMSSVGLRSMGMCAQMAVRNGFDATNLPIQMGPSSGDFHSQGTLYFTPGQSLPFQVHIFLNSLFTHVSME